MFNDIHEANRKRWDAASEGWARGADSRAAGVSFDYRPKGM